MNQNQQVESVSVSTSAAKPLSKDQSAAEMRMTAAGSKKNTTTTSTTSSQNQNSGKEAQAEEEEEEELPQLLYRIHYEKDEPYGVKSVLTFRPIQEGEEVAAMDKVQEMFIQSDSPQLLAAQAMEEEEKAYARKHEKRNLADAKAFDKMMSASPAGEPKP